MKKIVLLCTTLGLSYGSSVEVGNEPGQISKEEAEVLVAEGNAKILIEKEDGSNQLLKKQVTEKDATIDSLKNELEDLKKQVTEKDATIDNINKKLETLEKVPKK